MYIYVCTYLFIYLFIKVNICKRGNIYIDILGYIQNWKSRKEVH